MSDFAEKFEQRKPSADGRAQATRKQLLARWGSQLLDANTIVIMSMGRQEVWHRLSGDVFEQVHS